MIAMTHVALVLVVVVLVVVMIMTSPISDSTCAE
jgi:hypothetical protein